MFGFIKERLIPAPGLQEMPLKNDLPSGLKELSRHKFSPIKLRKGDSLSLRYTEIDGTRYDLGTYELTDAEAMTVDGGIVFSAEAGVFGEGRALGGVATEKT
jgi:hypothetical protein